MDRKITLINQHDKSQNITFKEDARRKQIRTFRKDIIRTGSVIFLYFSIQLYSLVSLGQIRNKKAAWPQEIENNLVIAGTNRLQLEKVLSFFKKDYDTLKLQAACFLIANMDAHYSVTYCWVDSLGKTVEFDELSYPNPEAADLALDIMKVKKKLRTTSLIKPDLKHIGAEFLIAQIQLAFKAWRAGPASNLPFKDFCEYILPYRVTVEPLQDWHGTYLKRYGGLSDSLLKRPLNKVLAQFGERSYREFRLTTGLESWRELLPRLGGLQLLFRKSGECGDVTTLQMMALRVLGIPVSYNSIPFWATSTGSHYLATAFDDKMQPMPLYQSTEKQAGLTLVREPSKVIRTTYSKQPGTLASTLEMEAIPNGFMQTRNYVDVTGSYWTVNDVKCRLWQPLDSVIVYAGVFSGGNWRPVWWAKPVNGYATFTQMPEGVIVLPVHYRDGILLPAGYPKVSSLKGEVLEPNMQLKSVVHIKQEARYLIFRPGKKYTLYYWDKNWVKAGEQLADQDGKELVFNEVPSNAVYLLIPEYSVGRERPFTIAADGARTWY